MIKYEVVAQNKQVLVRNLTMREALIVVLNLEVSYPDDRFMIRKQKR